MEGDDVMTTETDGNLTQREVEVKVGLDSELHRYLMEMTATCAAAWEALEKESQRRWGFWPKKGSFLDTPYFARDPAGRIYTYRTQREALAGLGPLEVSWVVREIGPDGKPVEEQACES